MKLDKQGKYRFNMYLNPNIDKDRVIIEYLEQRYSAPDFIKETLYSMATGSQVSSYMNNNPNMNEVAVGENDEDEPIDNPDDIDLEME